MLGFLDEQRQAFLTIDFRQGPLDMMIDTGFVGTLLIDADLFDESAAELALGNVRADLAAGQHTKLPSFLVQHLWFNEPVISQVLIGPGKECLLGTELLCLHRLEIDYVERLVNLS